MKWHMKILLYIYKLKSLKPEKTFKKVRWANFLNPLGMLKTENNSTKKVLDLG